MEHLKRWERPSHFADFAEFDRREYFVAIGRHRDSDTLTESNWRVLLKRLGGESETVLIIRDSHWAVGWVEAIYIHESNTTALGIADEARAAMDDYPVLDESDWSQLEWDEAAKYWASIRPCDRIDWCRRYDISIFAARRDELPDDPGGELVSALAN